MEETYNQYILEWKDKVQEAALYLLEQDFTSFEECMKDANIAYEKYKRDTELTYECKTFGIAYHILESILPNIVLNKDKKAIKEITKLIKEDKNLCSQYQLFNILSNYDTNDDAVTYVNEAFDLASKNIDKRTIKESNKKLDDVFKKYNIKALDEIPSNKLTFFENCEKLLIKDKSLSNLSELNNKKKAIINYIKENSKSKSSLGKGINEFIEKINNVLTEDERSFVAELIDMKSEGNKERKEKLFNKYKNECLQLVDSLINEENDKESTSYNGLANIKKQINEKNFCLETIVQDMAKFLEIRDVLMSE